MEGSQYPFAKRNKAIEETITKEVDAGNLFEDALQTVKEKHDIDDASIDFLQNKDISKDNMELFYTSAGKSNIRIPNRKRRWQLGNR